LWTLAFCLVIRGDVVQGLKLVETTLTHFTKPETSGEQQERLHARLRMFQGTFLFYAGRLVEVSDLLANVLDRLRRVGSVQDIGWNLVILSNAMVGPEGNVYIEEGLATVRSSGPRWLEGFISGRLADRLRWYDKRYSSEKYEQFALHAVSIGQQLNNPWILCDALLTDGILAIDQGMYHRAEKTCLQALMVAGQIDSLWMRGRALAHLSRISYGQGRFARAKQYIFESDLCFRRMGAMSWVAALFSFLGEIARVEGELDQAVSHYEAFLAQREELGLNSNLPIVSSLGHVFLRQLRLEQASNCFQKILVDAEWEDTFLFGMSFAGMAGVLVSTRRPNLAARLAGVAAASFTAFQYPLELADQQDWDRILAEIKESLDEETFTAAWNEGQQMSLEQAIAYALEVVN
jgi:tetratricopeptide (TPR) repeat protein